MDLLRGKTNASEFEMRCTQRLRCQSEGIRRPRIAARFRAYLQLILPNQRLVANALFMLFLRRTMGYRVSLYVTNPSGGLRRINNPGEWRRSAARAGRGRQHGKGR
jgi:hypothetical protein